MTSVVATISGGMCVRQDDAEHDARIGGADGACGLDELEVLQSEELGSRVRRASWGQSTTPIAIDTLVGDGPNRVTMTRANKQTRASPGRPR